MTSDEFRALLKRDRELALRAYFDAWLDANSESRRDTIESLAAWARRDVDGVTKIVLGADQDIAEDYDEMVGNFDEDEDDDGADTAEEG